MSSIKSGLYELFVYQNKVRILSFLGKTKIILYDDIDSISYLYSVGGKKGYICFENIYHEKTMFWFSKKNNPEIKRVIEKLQELRPDLKIAKLDPQQGNNVQEYKKPKKKKWIIAIFAIFVLIGIGGRNNDNSESAVNSDKYQTEQDDKSNELTTTETTEVAEETNTFYVGDAFESDIYTIMFIDSGEYTTDNQFMQPESGNKYVYAEFSITNNDDIDRSIGAYSFDCYADDVSCSSHFFSDNDLTVAASLSPGRNTKGRVYYEVPQNSESIEIEFETSFWTQNKIYFIID